MHKQINKYDYLSRINSCTHYTLIHLGVDTYEWRAAAPTLFDFVLTVTSSIHRRDLTHIRTPTQHPCMQPPDLQHALTPSTRHVSEICNNCVPEIFLSK